MDDAPRDELYEGDAAPAEESAEEPTADADEAVAPRTPTAPPPPPADQPGVGRAANPERDDRLGPTPSVSADRIGRRTEAARARRRQVAEESVSGSEE